MKGGGCSTSPWGSQPEGRTRLSKETGLGKWSTTQGYTGHDISRVFFSSTSRFLGFLPVQPATSTGSWIPSPPTSQQHRSCHLLIAQQAKSILTAPFQDQIFSKIGLSQKLNHGFRVAKSERTSRSSIHSEYQRLPRSPK